MRRAHNKICSCHSMKSERFRGMLNAQENSNCWADNFTRKKRELWNTVKNRKSLSFFMFWCIKKHCLTKTTIKCRNDGRRDYGRKQLSRLRNVNRGPAFWAQQYTAHREQHKKITTRNKTDKVVELFTVDRKMVCLCRQKLGSRVILNKERCSSYALM